MRLTFRRDGAWRPWGEGGGRHRSTGARVKKRATRAIQLAGLTLLAVGGIGVALTPGAQAATLTSGPVTITTMGTVTAGTPYSSGQRLNISVAANTTMDNASLVAAGFPSGAVSIKALECADPGGLVANLPTKPTECDPNTIDSIVGANSDGSMSITGYTVYALPDSVIFGEPTTNTPVCGSSAATECVIGLFSNQNDFSKPLIFSAPFGVAANGDDGGKLPVTVHRWPPLRCRRRTRRS